MDTIVVATGMPFTLAFFDQPLGGVVELWQQWVQSGEIVHTRHEDPSRDSVVLLRPAVFGAVEFIPHESAGRSWADRMLYSLPCLQGHPDAGDLPPDRAYYWTLNLNGFSATPERLTDGRWGLVLGSWDLGRI